MVIPNREKSHKNHKVWDTASQVRNVKNSDICPQRIWKLFFQFCSLTLANLPWQPRWDICFSDQTWNSDLEVSEDLQSSKVYLPIHHYLNIKKSIKDGKRWSVFLICFFGHGVLHIEQFGGVYDLHFKGEETDSENLRNIPNFLKLLSGSTEI